MAEAPANPGDSPGNHDWTVVNVESALYQLYFDPDMEHKSIAQKWLTQAQASAEAWHFCWALLAPNKIPEVQFFGASTLHTKISRHWGDLPSEQHESLQTQLMAHILHFTSGPKMVLTRLCVALASLALNLIPHSWAQPVADMVRAFEPQKQDCKSGSDISPDPQAHCLALLEIFTVLPEEFQSSRLTQARRAQLREALIGEWSGVCPMLRQLLQSQDSSNLVKEKVLRCLSSWVGLDVPLGESYELVQDCFGSLSNPKIFDTAVETIVTAISQPDCQRYMDALLKLLPLVLGLYEQLKKAAQDRDMETSHGICRIAVAMGETHSSILLNQVDRWQEYLSLVDMILFCTGMPGHYPVSETTSSLTLTFWYTLQDDILSFDEGKQTVYLQVYRPIYFQLVDVLLHKSHYPPQEEYDSWASDDKEQFRIYRVDISDTLMYVYEMLGAELLSNLYDRLGRQLVDPQQSAEWQETEALLFGFQSIAETIDVNYSDVIPGLIGLIPRINISNVMLADTVMYTIGSLAEWLADHPVMLSGVLPMVLQGLVKPELSVSSVSTLKRICRECRQDLSPYARDILTVSQDVLMKTIHKSSQCMWLMQALGFLLSGLPVDEILGHLSSLITPHVQQLGTLAQQEPNTKIKEPIIHILGMLANLFTTLDVNQQHEALEGFVSAEISPLQTTQHPVVVVLQQVFELIQTILSKWLDDSDIVEAVCGVFDKTVRTLLHDFGPMVAQLSEMLGQIYSAYPQPSALDLARQMVHIFAGEENHISNIKYLVQVLSSATLVLFRKVVDKFFMDTICPLSSLLDEDLVMGQIYEAGGKFPQIFCHRKALPGRPRDHPDVAESFMYLHAQILKRKPEIYLSEQMDLKSLFYCGIMSFKFPETPTVKAASQFFTELLNRYKDMPQLHEVLEIDGKILTETILESVGGGAPRSLSDYSAEVLHSLNRQCPALLSQWLTDTLQVPGFPSAHVSTEQKHTFTQQLLREQNNKRHVKEIVKEFSLLCRGLQGFGHSEF